MLRVLCIFVFFLSATAAHGEDYKISLRNLGGSSATCADKIQEAALAFEERTSVIVVEAACKRLTQNIVNGEITYLADEVVKRSNTYTGISLASPGRFLTEQECLVNLESESNRFAELTGLEVWFKYCSNDYFSASPKWALNIEALGESTVKYLVGSAPVYGKVMATAEEFLQTIKDKLAELEVTYVDVVIHNQMVSADLVVHYYSNTRVSLQSQERLKFPSTEACMSANEWVKSVFGNTNQLVSYCASVMGKVELGQIFFGPSTLGAGASIKKFDSYSACLAEEYQQNQSYADKLGDRYLGGRCAYAPESQGSTFALNFFYKK